MLDRFRGATAALILTTSAQLMAQSQIVPGPGNGTAADIARGSRVVQTAMDFLVNQAKSVNDRKLRSETLDAISNPGTCVFHRAGLTDAAKDAILTKLKNQGLVRLSDDATFPGGLRAGVFPPLLNDGGNCPQLPQPFYSAPGSVFHGHHSYPGGLAVHESFNLQSSLSLANFYRGIYGKSDRSGLPVVDPRVSRGLFPRITAADIHIEDDIMISAPEWHDW